jgi:NAD(P)-dependent dehydrogenase (short-subunit alcohol dehydrogenase family)
LGRTIAKAFNAEGANVAVCDVNREQLDEFTLEIPEIAAYTADVADPDAVRSFFEAVMSRFGSVDVLVNNAGVAGPTARLEDVDGRDWSRTLAVNLDGPFWCAREVVPSMKGRGGGAIVNISSTTARTGLPYRLPYAVSKSGVLGLTHTMARELGPDGIRVNAILPGVLRGERIRRVISAKAEALGMSEADYEAEMLARVSMRTMIDPDEVADMALFLASTRGRHVSGQFIGVCGNVEHEA